MATRRLCVCMRAGSQNGRWKNVRCMGLAASALLAAAGSTTVFCDSASFTFDKRPDGFSSPLFHREPNLNTASTNPGHARLWVGGAGLNQSFFYLLRNYGLIEVGSYCERYGQLHGELLDASRKEGGCTVSAANVPRAKVRLWGLHLAAAYGRAGEVQPGELPDFSASTGAVFLDVFTEEARPVHQRNLAMLYVVGPQGQKSKNFKKGEGAFLDQDAFLASIERLGRRALETVRDYNSSCVALGLPVIEEVRWAPVSCGASRHGDCTRLDVAKATLRGMQSVTDSNVVVAFHYAVDDKTNGFRQAAKELEAERAS